MPSIAFEDKLIMLESPFLLCPGGLNEPRHHAHDLVFLFLMEQDTIFFNQMLAIQQLTPYV